MEEENDYPKGSLWQDDSSFSEEDGKVDFYLKKKEWEFFLRDYPIPMIRSDKVVNLWRNFLHSSG